MKIRDEEKKKVRLTLEPVDLPQLSFTDALIVGLLVVESTCHWTAMDGVHDPVGGPKPDLISPFLWLPSLGVLSVVVVYQVKIFQVFLESSLHRGGVFWMEHSVYVFVRYGFFVEAVYVLHVY